MRAFVGSSRWFCKARFLLLIKSSRLVLSLQPWSLWSPSTVDARVVHVFAAVLVCGLTMRLEFPSRKSVGQLTIVVALEHLHLLLIIRATEKLTLLDDVLIALLQLHPANHLHDDDINQGATRPAHLNTHADKAFNVEHVVDSPHNQLVTSNLLRTTKTPVLHEQSSVFVVVGAIRRVLIVYDAAKAAEKRRRRRQQHSTFEIKGKEDERRKWL